MAPLIPIAFKLASFVPFIAQLMGGDKAGEVAEKVLSVARTVTGIDAPEFAVEAIQANPEKAAEFQLAMADKKLEFERLYLSDVQNARAMQVAALGQEDVFSKRFVYYFAAAWSLFTMCYLVGVTFAPALSESGKANSATVLGFLMGTVVASIFAWLFGSTKGSKEKDQTISALSKA